MRNRPSKAEVFHRSLFLQGPAGRLEALLWTAPSADPNFVALVCHPHPLYGGTMHNKVVYQAAKAFQRRGAAVLRFNFRGAGLSQGTHDGGAGEQDDVRAALQYLAEEFPRKSIVLAGFSFGSWVGLRVGCQDSRVSHLVALGLPVNNVDVSFLRECRKPKLFIQGGRDQFGSRETLEPVFATFPEPKQLVIVEGADHFFGSRLDEIGTVIGDWVGSMGLDKSKRSKAGRREPVD